MNEEDDDDSSNIMIFKFLKEFVTIFFTGKNAADSRDDNNCELVGTFSLVTQGILGLLCLLSLLVKRYYEYPMRRTWCVWFFDVLKQVLGAIGIHIFNVVLSVIKGYDILAIAFDDTKEDPCDWYFLSIVFDCTVGVLIFYFVFTAVNIFCSEHLKMTQIESGKYGSDLNNPSMIAYIKQLAIYIGSLTVTKVIIYIIMECFDEQLLWITSHILLGWLDKYPDEITIFVVMFVVPVFMNCLQLVSVDSIISYGPISDVSRGTHIQDGTSREAALGRDRQLINYSDYLHMYSQKDRTLSQDILKYYGTFND